MGIAERLPRGMGKTSTLGVMLDRVGEAYQMGILAGVSEAATSAGANVLCFVGGSLPEDPDSTARHRIFDMVGPHNVDGMVVLTATLMHQVGRAGVEEFCASRLRQVPHCSIGVVIPGGSSVTSRNDRGVRQIVEHLAQEHGKRRIAFVRGPLANEEAEDRYRAFVAAMQEQELSLDPRLVAVGDFLQASGAEAVRTFAQIAGMRLSDLDAIIASNDVMAIGILKALDERGIAVPDSIAVTGFDDIEDAHLTTSPLTTVRQPLEKIGLQAARNVLHFIQAGTAPETIEIDTEMVLRRSCGCSQNTRAAMHSAAPELNYGFEAALVQRRQHIIERLTRAARGGMGAAGGDWQARLLNAFIADLREDRAGAFRSMVADIGEKLSARGTDVQVCHDVVNVLRRQVAVTMRSDPIRRDKAEEIFYTSHLTLSEIGQRGVSRERLRLGRWGREIGEACNNLSRAFDAAELRRYIRDLLPSVGLVNYFVVLYSAERGPAGAELFAASDDGNQLILPSDPSFDGSRLLPKHLMESISTGRSFVVLPLTWRNLSLGHVLFELNFESLYCFDIIAEAIASGVFAVRLASRHCGKCFGGQLA